MRLILANDEQKAARDRLTATSAWGQGLTVEQFLERERRLRAHGWAREALRSWWWVDEGGAPLASCETFDVESRAGDVEGLSHLVASVFTAPALRGRGHASAMLREVLRVARRPTSQAFVLFSEVGVALYQRLGFVAAPGFDVLLPPREGPVLPPAESIRRVHAPPAALTLVRTEGFVDWQWERERAYAELLGRAPCATHTARLEGATIGWTAYFRQNELHVLWLDEAPLDVSARLLAAAQQAAFAAGLTCVRVWVEREPAWAARLPGARVVSRDDEVPMFHALVPGVDRWLFIERAGWA